MLCLQSISGKIYAEVIIERVMLSTKKLAGDKEMGFTGGKGVLKRFIY